MNQDEIRKNCLACGHRSLVLMTGSEISTDFCDHAQMECSKIVYCHESIRIPKKKARVQTKRATE